ncbi:MAG: 2Fe-2S iron-sulfur cluster-binding protein [Gammaproteobacteria bacterium]|nr:2Fe-2S iron-sulfur cluster-binding protein [Gammaproteobacteria bacterium]MDE0366880.1 2Fe-2S iron-sulfur cluster-binding protein [Gammaproteobacteria bacterium]
MPTVHVTDRDGNAHRLHAAEGSVLMEVLRDGDMGIEAICGGQCACATCHCLIDPDWFGKTGARGGDEEDLVSCLDAYDAGRSRLTCQLRVSAELDGLSLTVAPEE